MKHKDIPARNQKIAQQALQGDITVRELADMYELSETYIVRVVNDALKRSRTGTDPIDAGTITKFSAPRKPRKEPKVRGSLTQSERIEAMAEMYDGGATLQEVGDHFEVTRERVRQILRKTGRGGRRPREAFPQKLAEDAKLMLVGEWLQKQGIMTVEQLTAETGLTAKEYALGVSRGLIPGNLVLSNVGNNQPVYTYDDAVAAIAAAYERSGHATCKRGGAFSGDLYETWKLPNEPSHVLISMRWRWSDVATAAGVPTIRRNRIRKSTMEGAIASIAKYLSESIAVGGKPTANGYHEWSRGKSDCYTYPTVRLVLRRAEMTWQEAVLIAAQQTKQGAVN